MRITSDEVRNNKIKSYFLILFFVFLAALLGSVFGMIYGNLYFGIGITIIFATFYTLIMYYSGSKMILAMSGAKPVTKKEFPHLYHTVEGLAIAAGIPTPKAYVIKDSALNAFATGRDPENAS